MSAKPAPLFRPIPPGVSRHQQAPGCHDIQWLDGMHDYVDFSTEVLLQFLVMTIEIYALAIDIEFAVAEGCVTTVRI